MHSPKHLGLVGSHDRNLSVSASGVFDILVLYKLEYSGVNLVWEVGGTKQNFYLVYL